MKLRFGRRSCGRLVQGFQAESWQQGRLVSKMGGTYVHLRRRAGAKGGFGTRVPTKQAEALGRASTAPASSQRRRNRHPRQDANRTRRSPLAEYSGDPRCLTGSASPNAVNAQRRLRLEMGKRLLVQPINMFYAGLASGPTAGASSGAR